jgi:hypothetical protein
MVAERELALNPIQFYSPSSSFRCHLHDQDVDALYNPTVGANLMSDEFALAFLGDRILTLSDLGQQDCSPGRNILE